MKKTTSSTVLEKTRGATCHCAIAGEAGYYRVYNCAYTICSSEMRPDGPSGTSTPLAFDASGQGNIQSTFIWLAVVDFHSGTLENTPVSEHQFLLHKTDGTAHAARDISFAGDL